MLKNVCAIFKKNYTLNYVVLAIAILLFSFLYVYFTGSSFRYVRNVFFLFLLITAMVLLGYLIVDYVILKLLHINVSFREIHEELAWINILGLIVGFTLSFGLFWNKTIIENINNIFKILLLIFKICVIKKSYDVKWKKMVYYCGIIVTFYVGLHLLSMLI